MQAQGALRGSQRGSQRGSVELPAEGSQWSSSGLPEAPAAPYYGYAHTEGEGHSESTLSGAMTGSLLTGRAYASPVHEVAEREQRARKVRSQITLCSTDSCRSWQELNTGS